MPRRSRNVIMDPFQLREAGMKPDIVYTIGHSTRPIDEFIRLLKAHGVQRVVDVRTIPRSRHNPQFNRDQLSPALHRARIHYRHMPGLGGLRRPRPTRRTRGGATPASAAMPTTCRRRSSRTAWMRCIDSRSRSGRADVRRGGAVALSPIADCGRVHRARHRREEITTETKTSARTATPFARVDGTRISYPAIESA